MFNVFPRKVEILDCRLGTRIRDLTEYGTVSEGGPCRKQGRGAGKREMRGNISNLKGRFLSTLIGVVQQIDISGNVMFIDICMSINSTSIERHGFFRLKHKVNLTRD